MTMIRGLLCLLLCVPILASAEAWKSCCSKCDAFRLRAAREAGDGSGTIARQYAPDRLVDVLHLKLEVTPDFDKRTVSGTSELRFSPIAKAVRVLALDAVDLTIESVESTHELEGHSVEDTKLVLTFKKPIKPSEEAVVTVTYSAQPDTGLYFRTPEMGYPETDVQCWSQGEPEAHRNWFPSYDSPNERFSTEMICHVPEGMVALSNGRLLSSKTADGMTTFHWLQEKPHVNYLVTLVAGYFEKLEDKHGDLELSFWTPPSVFEHAENSFRDTRAIIEFFEKETGVPYPWAKYGSVCVHDFIAGGMENTSLTTLTLGTLFSKDVENLKSSRGLDAHEIAHQWFGDLVTCKDWSQLWLNEGFATYYTQLYEEEKFDTDHLRYGMWKNARGVLNNKDRKPIVWRGYKDPWEQFDYRAYPKGSWVLHMLRSQLGPDLFRRCVKIYLTRHANDVVVTEDLNAVIEEISGRSFDRFFDQWVYHGGTPKLKIQYKWDEAKKEAKITVEQTQEISGKLLLFHLPLPVRFITEDGVRTELLEITRKKEDFEVRLPGKPRIVRIDPEYTVLAAIDFKPPNPELFAQLKNQDDMMGRLIAVGHLADRKDHESIEKLASTLRGDPFFGVRLAAAEALSKRKTPEALDALLGSRKQPDARVRQAVVRGIGRDFGQKARQAMTAVLRREKNPEIRATAVAALGKYADAETGKLLVAQLKDESFRQPVARAAISAMKTHDDSALAGPLLAHLNANGDTLESRSLGSALETLAYLSRESAEKTELREFLLDYIHDARQSVQLGTVRALGVLGDSRALGALDSFRSEDAPDRSHRKRLHDAAAKSIDQIRKQEPPQKDFGEMRRRMIDLEKSIEQLKKQVEEAEKVPSGPQIPEQDSSCQ